MLDTTPQPRGPAAPLSIVDQAIRLAAIAHRGQIRKGTSLPYIVHPFAVGLLLQRAGCTEDVVAAGILHDVLEDTTTPISAIVQACGEIVANIVVQCSEPDKSMAWEIRKEHTITLLRTAPLAVKLVAAADKLDNLRSIRAEHHHYGEQVWARFRRGRDKQAWYYRSVAASLAENLPAQADRSLFQQLHAEVEGFFGNSR